MSTESGSPDRPESVGARVSVDLKRRVRLAAARENKNVSEWLRDYLDENLPEE
jgi:hypothetical protein